MMKKLSLFLLLLLFAVTARAQNSTTVTINVTDSGGVAWNSGTYKLTFVGPANANWPGGAISPTLSGNLNTSGSATQSTPNNNTITPSPSFWTVQVCPNPGLTVSSGCFILASQTITGAAQTLTITPPAISILGATGLPVAAYADAEIVAPVPLGFIYFQFLTTTTGTYRQCQGLTGTACTTWANVGAAGTGTVTTTGSPVSGNLTGFSGTTSITAASGDEVSDVMSCVAASGSGTTYTCTTAPTFVPAAGDMIFFEADVANTGAATLNVNASVVAPINKQGGGTALVANDLLIGQWVPMIFDGTNWQMEGQSGNAASSTPSFPLTVAGTVTSGGIPCFTGTTTESSSALLVATNIVVGGGAGVCPSTSALQIVASTIQNATSGTNTTVTGGQDASSAALIGSLIVRGGDETGAGGASSTGGNALIRGGNNAATNAASQAGSVEIIPGSSTGATQGLQGLLFLSQSYVKGGGTSTLWNLQCIVSTTAMTVNDCAASPPEVIGVALAVNANTVQLHSIGSQTPVNASAAVTVGDTVCAGTTAGMVTDSGGTAACTVGFTIGQVIAVAGTYVLPISGSVTLSTTLPLISFNRGAGFGNVPFSGITSSTNTVAAMVIGTGASLNFSGSGTINASSLGGATFAAPGTIGGTTPGIGDFSALNCGVLNTTACVLKGFGTTSGSATLTWPAVAGTTGNPIVSSNALSVPPGSVALPGLVFTGQAVGLLALHSGELITSDSSGNGTISENTNVSGRFTVVTGGAYTWSNSATAVTVGNAQDTGLGRGAAGIVTVDTSAIGNGLGTLQAALVQTSVGTQTISGADYTNSTTTPSTVFSWTLPATTGAKNYRYKCDIMWESTAATLVGPVFGVNISAAPTQLTAAAAVQNTLAGADINGYLSNATTGSQTLVTSSAAGVTSTNYWAKIWGTIEGAATAGSTFIINAASTSGTTALLNIRRGSGCTLN